MLLWDSACIVHDEFKAKGILDLKAIYPEAAVLAHPESPESVLALADKVGSTTQIIRAAEQLSQEKFIVATDQGIFFKLSQLVPDKQFLIAPTGGAGASCKSCANCPWMAMNNLDNLIETLLEEKNEIHIDEEIRKKAFVSTNRMIEFAKSL